MRMIRKLRGMSQHKLARAAGVPPSTIGGMEHAGNIPGGEHAVRLSRALGVHTEWLLLGSGLQDAPMPGTAAYALVAHIMSMPEPQQDALLALLKARE